MYINYYGNCAKKFKIPNFYSIMNTRKQQKNF